MWLPGIFELPPATGWPTSFFGCTYYFSWNGRCFEKYGYGKVYVRYQEHILPTLLDTYHYAFELGTLPESFYDASIVTLLKPDKNPEDCGSYRPISLLNID